LTLLTIIYIFSISYELIFFQIKKHYCESYNSRISIYTWPPVQQSILAFAQKKPTIKVIIHKKIFRLIH